MLKWVPSAAGPSRVGRQALGAPLPSIRSPPGESGRGGPTAPVGSPLDPREPLNVDRVCRGGGLSHEGVLTWGGLLPVTINGLSGVPAGEGAPVQAFPSRVKDALPQSPAQLPKSPAQPSLPVGEPQPEHIVDEQPQGLHRSQQQDVADVELDPPHVFPEE